MAIQLTHEMLRMTYELLRLTLPYRRWHLPHADKVEFHVMAYKDRHSDALTTKGQHRIRVSNKVIQTLAALTEAMAHEMIHLHDTSRAHHGRVFHKHADQVCKRHGFDRGRF